MYLFEKKIYKPIASASTPLQIAQEVEDMDIILENEEKKNCLVILVYVFCNKTKILQN